jgi:hypothetical protein
MEEYLTICSSFDEAVSISEYKVFNKMIIKSAAPENVEGRGRGLLLLPSSFLSAGTEKNREST